MVCVACNLFLAWACDSGVASGTFVARDSAGIRIVENLEPQWGASSNWRVVEPPLADIGVADGEEVYQLFNVRMAVRQSDGTIVVINGGTQELRFYDSTGRHIRSIGGQGGGPDEFTTLEFVALLPGDSLLAFNRAPARISILAADGTYVRSFAAPEPPDRRTFWEFEVAGLLDGQQLVVWSAPIYRAGYAEFTDGMNRRPHPIGIADLLEGTFDSIAAAPGWDIWVEPQPGGGTTTAAPPFARSSDIVAKGDRIYVAGTDQIGITVLAPTGTPLMITRADREAPAVTDDDYQAWKDDIFERFPITEAQRPLVERLLAAIPVPPRFPAFRGADVDAAGNMWLHAYPNPGEDPRLAHVFNPEGRWLGEITMPAGLKRVNELDPLPLQIGEDYLLGVFTDSTGIEHVRLYRVER